MSANNELRVRLNRFDEKRYVSENTEVLGLVSGGKYEDALDHYVKVGIDESRVPLMRMEPLILRGSVEQIFVSESGYVFIVGWLSDEGVGLLNWAIIGADFKIEIEGSSILRHARRDVEGAIREGAYDYGFKVFGKCQSSSILKQPSLFKSSNKSATFQLSVTPEIVSDKRMLEMVLIETTSINSHSGREGAVSKFVASNAGKSLTALFGKYVFDSSQNYYVERFNQRAVNTSFVTVLFGSSEAVLLQPILFRKHGVDFGEWIYVCNSPEDAQSVARLARLVSDLYGFFITIILLSDNVGFGAANNIAVEEASSNKIYVVNPDVFPMNSYSKKLNENLSTSELGKNLWGGLLFYDDYNLMHSGMYIDKDIFVQSKTLNNEYSSSQFSPGKLLRVEHFDKGVPFQEEKWKAPKQVSAITGALMAFKKDVFQMIGGFSTKYIYGHYEDADLSLRWAERFGPVLIDPELRMVHLEGQGSRARGKQYGGAAFLNRYYFTNEHQSKFV